MNMAQSLARHLISRSSVLIYQCRDCGRLYICRRDRIDRFVPETERTHREALRSRPYPE